MNSPENQSKINVFMKIIVGIFAVIGAFASIVQILEWFGISPKKNEVPEETGLIMEETIPETETVELVQPIGIYETISTIETELEETEIITEEPTTETTEPAETEAETAPPDYESGVEFLKTAFDAYNADVFTEENKTFQMKGKSYQYGVKLNYEFFNPWVDTGSRVSFNTSDIDELHFSIGHIDNEATENAKDCTLTIYLENKEYDKISLSANMPLTDYVLNVENAEYVCFDKDYGGTYVLTNFYTKYQDGD